MNKIACCFTCKNSLYIYQAVESIQKYYADKGVDIIIIDSDSDDKQYFDLLKKNNNIYIQDINNKQYEYGGIVSSYNQYPLYDSYIFLQDSVYAIGQMHNIEFIPNDTVYIIQEHYSGWTLAKGQKEIFEKLNPNFPKRDDEFMITIFNCFIINNNTMKKIIESKIFQSCTPAYDKHTSIAWERAWAIIFDSLNINVELATDKNNKSCFYKKFGGRQ